MNYYSPELVRYIQGSARPEDLTEASDIFALGLIYAEYLTGRMPAFDPAHHEPAIAVLNGERLRLAAGSTPPAVVDLVERMLLLDPAARPTVGQVHATLMGLRGRGATTTARAPIPVRPVVVARGPAPSEPPRGPSVLRGKGLRLTGGPPARPVAPGTPAPVAAPPAGDASTTAPPPHTPTLLGRLIGKLENRRPR